MKKKILFTLLKFFNAILFMTLHMIDEVNKYRLMIILYFWTNNICNISHITLGVKLLISINNFYLFIKKTFVI